ncbi:MAG: phage holin family protein [Muribaculaceae bacterium]|nr:phage holin family protein [Muribaculaceae bacterium]
MITRLFFSSLAVLITSLTLDGVAVDPWWWAVIVAIVLGFINSWIRPIVKFLSIPINMLTLGLFTLVINALMVMLCSWVIGPHFVVANFWWALLFSIVLTLVAWLLHFFFPSKE